jgi:hypothetical protein
MQICTGPRIIVVLSKYVYLGRRIGALRCRKAEAGAIAKYGPTESNATSGTSQHSTTLRDNDTINPR